MVYGSSAVSVMVGCRRPISTSFREIISLIPGRSGVPAGAGGSSISLSVPARVHKRGSLSFFCTRVSVWSTTKIMYISLRARRRIARIALRLCLPVSSSSKRRLITKNPILLSVSACIRFTASRADAASITSVPGGFIIGAIL